MCLFKKKKKVIREKIDSKFSIGQYVHFRFRDELYFGYIFTAYKGVEGEIKYDIQVGGQCPAIIKGVLEETIFILEDKK